MTGQNKKAFLIIAILAVVAIVGGFLLLNKTPSTSTETPVAENQSVTPKPGAAKSTEVAAKIDAKSSLKEKALGDEDAPVKIEEYASLTCSHCGHFYNDTFPDFKRKYIDTKKVYFVYSDFPLNAPAMHAAMIARCVPEGKFFSFIETLFAEQDKWSFEPDYLSILKTMAAKFGVNEATFQSCIQNTDIQKGIVARMEAAQTQWQIASTPTFIINNKKVMTGALPTADFEKMVDAVLANPDAALPNVVEAPIPAPAAAPPAAAPAEAPKAAETPAAAPASATTTTAPAAVKATTPPASTTATPEKAGPVKTDAATENKTAPVTTETPAETDSTDEEDETP